MTTRQKSPRRLVVEVLRDAVRRSRNMISIWDESQTVYDFGGGTHRRRADEKVENQASSWTMLAAFARSVSASMDTLAEYADGQRAALLAEAKKEAAK
jgi:hypothetical protein